MKLINYIFLLAMLSPFLSMGQDYQPMLNEGSFWDVCSNRHDPPECRYDPRRFYLDNDTIIEGRIYKKTRRHKILNTLNFICPFWNGENYIDSNYTYPEVYIREDIIEKKVYVWAQDPNNGNGTYQEYILYDFNLEVGNNLPENSYAMDGPTDWTITNIYEDSEGRKMYDLNNGSYYYSYTEGIGGYSGIICPILTNFEAPDELYCFGDSNNQNDCLGHLDVDEYPNIDFAIYPNPAHNEVFIKCDKNITVDIFTVLGKQQGSYTIDKSYQIDLTNYQTGVYFLKITDVNHKPLKSLKLVISKL